MKRIEHYWRKAVVLRVYDGDTPALDIKLGYHCRHGGLEVLYRMTGMNAPEMNSKDPDERLRAENSRDRLRKLIELKEVVIHSRRATRPGAYGRFEIELWTTWVESAPGVLEVSGPSVNKIMVDEGYAVKNDSCGAMIGAV